jgi:hypothetical protein
MDPNEVLRVEDAVFILRRRKTWRHMRRAVYLISYLTSCINDLSGVLLTLVLDNFAKRILDSRIIALYKVPVHKPHGE